MKYKRMKIVYIDGWYHVEQTWMSGKVIITPYRWKDKRIAQSYIIAFMKLGRWQKLTDPCRYCVAPERYPGCHDHCEKLKAHRESDEYKKLCEYKNTYLKSHSTASSSQINKAMRYFKYKGYSLYGFKNVGSV